MMPLEMEDKATARMRALFSRFAIGFLIPLVKMPTPAWVTGILVGSLVSMPDAIITKAFTPILGVGVIGRARIGLAAAMWVA